MSLAEGPHLRRGPHQRPTDQPTTGLLGTASLTRRGLQLGRPSGSNTTSWLSGPPSQLPAERDPVQGRNHFPLHQPGPSHRAAAQQVPGRACWPPGGTHREAKGAGEAAL